MGAHCCREDSDSNHMDFNPKFLEPDYGMDEGRSGGEESDSEPAQASSFLAPERTRAMPSQLLGQPRHTETLPDSLSDAYVLSYQRSQSLLPEPEKVTPAAAPISQNLHSQMSCLSKSNTAKLGRKSTRLSVVIAPAEAPLPRASVIMRSPTGFIKNADRYLTAEDKAAHLAALSAEEEAEFRQQGWKPLTSSLDLQ